MEEDDRCHPRRRNVRKVECLLVQFLLTCMFSSLPHTQLAGVLISLFTPLAPQVEILGQSGFLFNFLRTHQYGLLLTLSCFLGPFASQILFRDMGFSDGKEPPQHQQIILTCPG